MPVIHIPQWQMNWRQQRIYGHSEVPLSEPGHFHVHEEGNLRNYLIPRMILQPLIENAIYYGVETSLDVCDITVRAKEMPDSVILSVEDNGQGMTQEELERVKDGSVIPKGHGIGIKNIRGAAEDYL